MSLSGAVAAIETENARLKARVALLEEMMDLDEPDIVGLDLMLKHKLPRQQAEVLRALIAARGKPLDRLALEGRITWRDHAADHDLKVFDVLISKLRGTIGREAIDTVYGLGWRVNPKFLKAA